jgi:hypothetical protein
MNANEVLQLAGAACKVADMAEELIEFIGSLGPDTLADLTNMDEFDEFCNAVEEYVDVRDTTDVEW